MWWCLRRVPLLLIMEVTQIVATDINKEAPNVVTETHFKTLVESGYQAEVVCKTRATKKAAVWYGIWIIRVVNKERTYEKLLVPARKKLGDDDEIAVRTFKTANGLISFLESMGFTQVNIPMLEGGRTLHALPDTPIESSDS